MIIVATVVHSHITLLKVASFGGALHAPVTTYYLQEGARASNRKFHKAAQKCLKKYLSVERAWAALTAVPNLGRTVSDVKQVQIAVKSKSSCDGNATHSFLACGAADTLCAEVTERSQHLHAMSSANGITWRPGSTTLH
eukprot:1411052-Amphidinium_carterae.1